MTAALFTAALFVAAGWPLATTPDAFRRIGLAYLFGAGLAFAVLLLESLLHVAWSRASLLLPLLLIGGIGALVRRRSLGVGMPVAHWLDTVTLVVVVGYVRLAVLAPTPEYDFIGIWGVKAKEFWLAGGVEWAWLANPFNAFAHVDYPLLMPLVTVEKREPSVDRETT